MENKQRIDLYLVEKKYCVTRSQAQQMIDFGLVEINGKPITKHNQFINLNDNIIVKKFKYVSRAGFKLEHALQQFNINLNNKVVLDIGASTGGFTDCCLQHGAKFVYALDVGNNQLATSLKNNHQVSNWENTNLKDIPQLTFSHQIDVIVGDVSFISLKHVFYNIQSLLNFDTILIFLIKPQFELDKKIIDKNKGVIKSPQLHQQAIKNVLSTANQYHLQNLGIIESPILGKKGENKEFLGLFKWVG